MTRSTFVAVAFSLTAFLPAQAPSIKVSPATEDPPVLAAVLNKLGADLAARTKDANLCLSPASIGLCLLMTLPGARGATAGELQKLLCPEGWDYRRTLVAARMLVAHLKDRQLIELAVVHDLWPQSKHPMLPDFLSANRAAFDAEVRPLDFASDPMAARKVINDHVAKATRDRIKDLLSPDGVGTDTRLVLTNAIYLNAEWQQQFAGSDTREGTFFPEDGTKVKVQMMSKRGNFALAEVAGLQVLRLPYADKEFAFEVALPAKDGKLAAAEAALRPEGMAAWSGAMKEQMAIVKLPRFRIEGSFDLTPNLRAMGLVQATTPMQADFSGMDGGAGKLFIGKVVHKTFIDVKEKGTEAAAATAVEMKAGSAMPKLALFTADRPFAYALRDLSTGLVLFAGRYGDPRTVKP